MTGLLLPFIPEAPGPRVVTVSSYAHTQGGPQNRWLVDAPPIEMCVNALATLKPELGTELSHICDGAVAGTLEGALNDRGISTMLAR